MQRKEEQTFGEAMQEKEKRAFTKAFRISHPPQRFGQIYDSMSSQIYSLFREG